MKNLGRHLADSLLRNSRVGLFPVRVRRGLAAGARWTLYPWTSYWRGTHEPALQEALRGLGGGNISGWSCWDLGAHYGLYSVGLALRVGPRGQVAAFEPNPRSFARLKRHRDMNRLSWLRVFAAAASDASGMVELLTYGELDSTTTHLAYEGERQTASAHPLTVEAVRLDDLVQSGKLQPPDFVKIDVEGHGHRALAGMQRTLAVKRPILAVSIHSTGELQGVLAHVEPLLYAFREIGGGPGRAEVGVGGDFLFTPRL